MLPQLGPKFCELNSTDLVSSRSISLDRVCTVALVNQINRTKIKFLGNLLQDHNSSYQVCGLSMFVYSFY